MGLFEFYESIGHGKVMAIVLTLLIAIVLFLLGIIIVGLLRSIFFPETIEIVEIPAKTLKGVVIP